MIDWVGSYCGTAPDAATWWAGWNSDPILIVALVLATGFFLQRGHNRAQGLAAVAVLALVFLSPLCALSVALFSARALHHLLLIGVAAPLLAVALPARRAMPAGLALAAAVGVLWLWHLPAAYDAALADKRLYWLMQASLLATAWAYWEAVRRAEPPLALTLVAAGAAQMGLLGAVLTFAPQPLYAAHLATTTAFGLGPLADQQLAGLAMWVLGLVPYAIAGAIVARGAWTRIGQPA